MLPERVCAAHTLMYLSPYKYEVGSKGKLEQREVGRSALRELLCLANSLTLNFYIRSKVSSHVSIFQFLELPIPELKPAARKQLAISADKLLKNPHDVTERAALEVFIARDLYGVSLEDWTHLTGTFTFGSGPSKEELDEIVRQSLVIWAKAS